MLSVFIKKTQRTVAEIAIVCAKTYEPIPILQFPRSL